MVMDLRDKVARFLPGYRLTCDHGFDTFSACRAAGVPLADQVEAMFFCTDDGPAIPCRVDDIGYVRALDDDRVLE